MQDDSFQDLPRLIRYAPERDERPQKPDIKPIEIPEDKQEKPFANILTKKPTTSDVVTPKANSPKKAKEMDLSDKQLSKLEKGLKVEKIPKMDDLDKAPPSTHKNVDKSKTLITQMVNKISAKNVAEELLPISMENIAKLTRELDEQKADLAEKAKSIEQQLRANPHNKNLQKQLKILEVGMERFDTMKLLYLDKVELRNENRRLLGIIEDLKKENKEIKAKIAQGINQIEAHMHNLPCDKEKALEIEIRKCQEELKSERDMRTTLEKNISNTIQNFARLYQEADLARKIVVNQLKEIEGYKLKARHQLESENGHEDDPSREDGIRKRQNTQIRKRQDSRYDHSPHNERQDRTALKPNNHNKSSYLKKAELPQPVPTSSRQPLDNQKTNRKHEKDLTERSSNPPSAQKPLQLPKGNLEDMVQRMRANQQKFKPS